MVEKKSYVAIGQVSSAHGIRGEVKVELLTDYPERFRPGAEVYIGSETEARLVRIRAARPHKQAMLVQFDSVPDRNAAEELRGVLVLIREEDMMPLGADENYVHDLLGLVVETESGEVLGKITEVLATGANDVYVVEGADGELLLPALRDVIRQVDLATQRMVVVVPEGLAGDKGDADQNA